MKLWMYLIVYCFSMLTTINASWFPILNQASQRKTFENSEENNFTSPINALYDETELLRKHLTKEKYNQRSLRKDILKIRKLYSRNLSQTKATFAETLNKFQREAEINLSKEKSLLLEETKSQLEKEKEQEIKNLELKYINQIKDANEELRCASAENSQLQINIKDIKDELLRCESEKKSLQLQLTLSTKSMRQEVLDLQAQLAEQQSQSSITRNHWSDATRSVEVDVPQHVGAVLPDAVPGRGLRHRSSSRRSSSISTRSKQSSSEHTNAREDQ